ncbi:MAG: T9SS type A sorting domain-containing protein [candidate division Zixibacteria bacterium]|nr:T9SS type A sorting domain-containing protein [candidate division Zixibacteria bacterium]
MKCLASVILLSIAWIADARAINLRPEPDYSFAWSTFTTVVMANDSIAVAASDYGFLSAKWDARNLKLSPINHRDVAGSQTERFIVTDSFVAAIGPDGSVCFLDRAALPQIVVLGKAQLPDSTLDILIRGRELYLAAGFRGLLHGRIDSYSVITVIDSEQTGVHLTAVDLVGDRVVVADDYNGILEYAIDQNGTPVFESVTGTSFSSEGLSHMGDTLMVLGDDHRTVHLAVKTGTAWNFVGSVAPPYGCDRVYVVDTFVVAIARDLSAFSLHARRDLSLIEYTSSSSGQSLRFPALFRSGFRSYLMVTGLDGGMLLYRFDLGVPPYAWGNQIYPLSGEIPALAITKSHVVAGGSTGWCRMWNVSSESQVDSEATLFDMGGTVGALVETSFGLAALNTRLNKLNLILESAGRLYPFATFFLGHNASGLYWPSPTDKQAVIFWSGPTAYVYRWNQGQLQYLSPKITTAIAITSACIVNNLILVAAAKDGVQAYRVGTNFEITYASTLPSRDIYLLARVPGWKDCVLGFSSNAMYRINFVQPYAPVVDTVITLPFPVAATYMHDTLLFTTGYSTTAVWSVPPGAFFPKMLGSCDRGGSVVAGNGNVMFLTTGKAIFGFDLRGPTGIIDDPGPSIPTGFALMGNYPNPFNPTTTIEYSLERTHEVQLVIYNTLGRRVRRLVDQVQPHGVHRVGWDARDDEGRAVASGVYFYRLSVGEEARVGKMVLVR